MPSEVNENQPLDVDLGNYQQLFLDEAHAFLATLRGNLSLLAEKPADRRARREALRAAHTLKGMAATMRYDRLAAQAKGLEDQLQIDDFLTPDQIDVLLAASDEYEKGLAQLDGGEEARNS